MYDILAEQQESLLVFFVSFFCAAAQEKYLHSLWMDEQQELLVVLFASFSFCAAEEPKRLHSLWMYGLVVLAALLQLQAHSPHRRKHPGYTERFQNS